MNNPGSMNLPADLQRKVDDARVVIGFRFPWWLRPFLMRGVLAITLGHQVYLQSDAADFPRLLRHELVHVRQIERLGRFRFYWSYVREYIANRLLGWPAAEAYRRISLEAEAFAAEREETL